MGEPPGAGEALKSDPPLAFAEAAGFGRFAYTDEGPRYGPAVVCIHGAPGSLRDFRYLAPHLSRGGARVLRLDLPGFGGSAGLAGADPSLEARARFVVAAADATGLARFALLGHSMGGGIAIATAALHAGRVRALLLLASLGARRHRGFGAPAGLYGAVAALLAVPGLRALLAARIRRGYRRRGFPTDGLDAATIRRHFRLVAAIDFAEMARLIGKVGAPALVAFARDDPLVEAWVAEDLCRRLPGSVRLEFESGGHYVQKHRAREIAPAIIDLLAAAPA